MIDKDKLPLVTRVVVEDYLRCKLPLVEYDYLVLLVQYAISKILCTNRIFIASGEIETHDVNPNLYILFFADSGSGKDRSVKEVDVLLEDFYLDFKHNAGVYRENKIKEIEKYIEQNITKKGDASIYRQENAPRYMKQEIDSNATLEGFLEARKVLQDANYGCSCWEDSEIFDTIKSIRSGNSNSKEFLKYNKEAFDHGFSRGKIIKGNKKPEDIEKVPHLVSLYGAIDTEDEVDVFKSFFDLGFGRRSFVLMADKKTEHTIIPIEKRKKLIELAASNKDYCKNIFREINERTKQKEQIAYPHSCKSFSLSPEVINLYYEYVDECETLALSPENINCLGIRNEIKGRHWKALKLAAIICIQEVLDGEGLIITKEHFEKAIYMTTYYGESFRKFYQREADPLEKSIADLIIQKGKIARYDLIRSKVIKGDYSKRQSVVYSLIDRGNLEEYLNGIGKTLKITQGRKEGSTAYSIEEIPEHENIQDVKVHYSQGLSNAAQETHMEPKEIAFSKFHEVVCAPYIYSSAQFKDDHRKGDNWLGNDDLIILDVDNEIEKSQQLTIEMAKERFKDFTYLIMPTKSHLKEKKGEVRERFRIIVPIKPMEDIDRDKYAEIVGLFIKNFNLGLKIVDKDASGKKITKSWVDLPAAKDPARMYYGHEAEPIYNNGLLFNWKWLLMNKKETVEKTGKNTFDSDLTLIVHGRPMHFLEYLAEAMRANGKTIPCNAHCHDDKNASAFISINKSGNFQYTCSACGISQFYRL